MPPRRAAQGGRDARRQCLAERGRVDGSAGATRPRTWHSLSPDGRTPSRKTPHPEGWPQWPQRGRFNIAPGSARGNRRGVPMSPGGGLQRPWRRECRAIGVARTLEAPRQGAVRTGAFPRALPGARLRSARCAWRGGERPSLPLSLRHCRGAAMPRPAAIPSRSHARIWRVGRPPARPSSEVGGTPRRPAGSPPRGGSAEPSPRPSVPASGGYLVGGRGSARPRWPSSHFGWWSRNWPTLVWWPARGSSNIRLGVRISLKAA